MKDVYGAKNPKSWYMKTHVQTAGCSLTEQQPLNNIVRVAYQAMAGVLGGCQSLHTDSMDETLGLPTEQAVTVALRTQQILAHETGVTRVVDPLGGSWFIESLTDTVEKEAQDLIGEIDDMAGGLWGTPERTGADKKNLTEASLWAGGAVQGIHQGYFRRKIAEASYRFAEECENKDRIIVGVNEYTEDEESRPIDILTISDEVETVQNDRLGKFKADRDPKEVEAALERIRITCRDGDPGGGAQGDHGYSESSGDLGLEPTNVMPALVNAALAGCTLGEMTQAMADIYGRYGGGPEW